MTTAGRSGKINGRVLIVLGVFVGLILLGVGAFYARNYRVRVMAERTLAEGRAAFEEGDYKEASKLLGRYLAKYPDDPEVLTQFAEAHLGVRPLEPRNIGSAITAYRRLLLVYAKTETPVDDTTLRPVYEKLARLYEQTGNFSELGFIAGDRRRLVPDDPQPALWLAKSLLAQRKPDEARSELQNLINRLEGADASHPEYVEACNLLAAIALEGRSLDEKRVALDWLARALEHDPGSVETLVQRATVYRELARLTSGDERAGFIEAAQRDLEAAEEVKPHSPLQHLMLVESWMTVDRFDRAAAHLKAARSADPAAIGKDFIDPDDWVVARFIVAAVLATRTADIADGVALADEALSTLTKKRHRMEVARYAIPLYVASNRVTDARQCSDELLREMKLIEPTPEQSEQAKYLEALVALAEGRPYEAVKLLEPLAAGGRAAPQAQRLLADAYIRVGRSERAISTLRDYLRSWPEDFAALANLVREYVKRGAWAEAVEAARRAEQMRPEDLELKLLRIRAQLGLLRDQPARARDDLKAELLTLRDLHPQREEIAVYLARLAVQNGDIAAAEAELRRAIEESNDGLLAAIELVLLLHVNRGNSEEAIEICRQACQRHASDSRAWLSFARLLTIMERHEEALDVLKQGSEAVTNDEDKRVLLRETAGNEILHGDRAAGIARLQRLAEERADDMRTRDMLLNVPEVLQDRGYAGQIVDEIKSVEGETGLLWRLHRARFLLSNPEWRLPENASQQREILDLLRFCVEASPSWEAPALALGGVYEILGRPPEAERLYSTALARGNASVTIAERLLSLFARQGRFDEARTLLERVRRGAASNRWSDHAILLAIQSGEFSSAISELEARVAGDNVRPEDLIKLANLVYLERRNAAEALVYLDRAQELAPDSLDWVAIRALILKEEGRVDEARRLVDEFARRKNDFASQLLRATFYQPIDDGGEAADAFELLPGLSPDGTGYAMLGEYHARAGRLSDAIAVWEQGLESFPKDMRLRRGIAKALILRSAPGDRERAESMLLELRRDLPDDGETLWVLAELKLGEGTEQSTEEAIGLLHQAIKLDPYGVEPYLRLIPLLLDCGELARAEEVAARALDVYPRDARLILAGAMVRLAAGDITGARERVQELLRAQPGNLQAVGTLAEIAMRSRDLDLLRSVRGQLAQAVEQQPENTWLHISYAVALVVDGQPEAALTLSPEILVTAADYLATSGDAALREHARGLYEHVINSAPQNAAAHFGLATLAYQRGDMEAALDGYRAALRLEPSNVDILNNLAWTLAEAYSTDPSVLEEALQHANEAVRLAPNDPNLRDTLGVVLSKLGRLQEAQAAYRKCVELSERGTPAYAKALLQLGRTCARLGDTSETRRCLQEAREIDRQQRDVFTPEERAEIAGLLEQTDAK